MSCAQFPPHLLMDRDAFVKAISLFFVKRLGVVDITPKAADTLIVDVSQLFFPYGVASWW